MPSRRIGSKSNLSPQQELTINPFNSFDSDNINKLTRIISNGSDGIVFGLDLNTNRRIPDSVFEKTTVKSGMFYNPDNWILTDKCEPELIGDNLKGFNITCVDDICTQEIKYILDSSMLPLNYIGSELKFNFKFKIDSGSPYKVIATVLDSEYAIQYPRHNGSTVTLSVIRRIEKEGNIQLRLTFILNPEDINAGAYGEYVPKPEVYEGQSDIRINDLEYSYEVISQAKKSSIYRNIYDRYDGNYPMSYIHPSNIIYVTPGLAIKDDVVLQENGLDAKFLTPAMKLEVGNDKSWVKGGAFDPSDFYQQDASQTAFVLNQDPPKQLLSGSIVGNDLLFSLGSEQYVSTIDNYELNDLDYEIPRNKISFTSSKTKYELRISNFDIEQNIDLYGSVLYIVHRNSNKILKQIEIIPNRSDTKLSYSQSGTIYINKSDFPIIFNENTDLNDVVKIIVSCGPIKVHGSVSEYNTNMVKWANVVIYYSYFKHPEPNKSYIGLLRDEDLNDPIFREDYLVLGRVRFISPTKIDIISYENRQNIYYFNEIAKHINYASQLDPIDEQVWVDPETGIIDVPEDISTAITKLADLINDVRKNIPDPSSYEDDVVYNTKNYLEEDKLVQWVPDSDSPEKGHLRSNISLDKPESAGGSGLSDRTDAIPTSALLNNLMDNKADLDSSGRVPASQLPAYVDDVLEYPTKDDFPDEGEDGKIYVDKYTNLTYRWSGTDYTEISPSLALGETSSTAFPGNRGKRLEENVDDHTQQIEDLQGRIFTPPNGKDGQFIRKVDGTPGEIEFDWLMQNGYLDGINNTFVCNTDEDIEKCSEMQIDASSEFEYKNWLRFGHTTAINQSWSPTESNLHYPPLQYGIDSNYPQTSRDVNGNPRSGSESASADAWTKIKEGDKQFAFNPCNQTDFSGYVTNKTFDNYDILIRIFSKSVTYTNPDNGTVVDYTASDNDNMSIAILTTDPNGRQHTISFYRSGDLGYATWGCVVDRTCFYNYNNNSMRLITSTDTTSIANTMLDNQGNGLAYWNTCGEGCLIRVVKEGNIIKAYTSKQVSGKTNLTEADLLNSSEIILDLDNFTVQRPAVDTDPVKITDTMSLEVLNYFKNKKTHIGYGACSQTNACFEFIKGKITNNGTIVDITKDRYTTIDPMSGEFVWNPGMFNVLRKGEFSYNSITKKLFWNDGTKVVQIKTPDLPSGQNGEVLYSKGNSDIKFGKILYDNIAVCETTSDAEKCKTKIDYNEIYSKWIKIGYYQNKQYKIDADYCSTVADGNIGAKQWHWNETKHAVENQCNSVDISGFVSTNPSKNIDVIVRFLSTNMDDDWNGLCLMVTDKNGRQHTISFLRNLQVCNLTLDPSTVYTTTDTSKYGEVIRYRGIIRSTETPDPTKTYYTPATDGTTGYKALTGLTTWPADIFIYEKITCRACKGISEYGPQQFYATLDINQNTSYTITYSNLLRTKKIDDPTSSDRKIIESPDGNLVDFYANYHQYSGTTEKMPKETIGEYYYSIFENSTPVKYGSWEFGQKARTCPVYMQPAIDDYRLCVPSGTLNLVGTSSTGKSISDSYSNHSLFANDLTIKESTPGNQLNKSKFQRHGWAGFDGGVILHMTYQQILNNNGDVDNVIIECETTPFMTTKTSTYQFKDQYKIRIDLKDILTNGKVTVNTNELLNTYEYSKNQLEILKLFMNPKGVRWGYLNGSQAGSTFENIRIITDNNPYIVDRESDKSYMFDGSVWNLVGDSYDILLPGRQYYNSLLDRLYWCDLEKNIVKIASSSKDIEQLEAIYPVGSIYIGTQAKCPFTGILGTWVKVSQGKCLWGAKDVMTDNEMPGDSIPAGLPKPKITAKSKWRYVSGGGGAEYTIHGGTGSSGAGTMKDNNVIQTTATVVDDEFYGKSTTVQPPAFIVNIWQRTA